MTDVATALAIRGTSRLVGFVAGIVCAIAAYDREPSFLLAVFVFFTASFLIGRALPDVLTKPHPFRRALYLLLLPALCAGVLTGTYLLVHRMWLAVLVGVIVGRALHRLLGGLLFARIVAERPGWTRFGPPARDDAVPGRWRRLP
jgi:hypothetical protein